MLASACVMSPLSLRGRRPRHVSLAQPTSNAGGDHANRSAVASALSSVAPVQVTCPILRARRASALP